MFNARSKWFGSYGAPAKEGTVFIDSETSIVREYINQHWVIKQDISAGKVKLVAEVEEGKNVESAKVLRAKFTRIRLLCK